VDRIVALRERLLTEAADAFICMSYPNYRYLSGFSGSLCVLLINRKRAVIMSDFRYRTQIRGEAPDFDYVEIVGPVEQTVSRVIEEMSIRKLAFEAAHTTYRQYAHLKAIEALDLIPSENWVEDLRVIKDQAELLLIEKAAAMADSAVEQIARELRAGMIENEVANRLNFLLRSEGAKKEAFDLIVASGPRSAMPHAASSERLIQEGEPIVIDIGAQFAGYHSDLTRTIWVGKINQKIAEVYEIVENAQAAAIQAVRPGIAYAELDGVARNFIEQTGYGEYFGHGLGHGVGLEVHEPPSVSRFGKGEIQPGMVFTVEPGIYLPEIGGVRIEDMVVVTEKGCRLLTKSPHQPEK
jgi:Xaa-Pro aminopeptidase